MIIANPLYDVVFKYLLDDIEIARELLTVILSEEVISLELKPQETVIETPGSSVNILRFDFKATIITPTGEQKKVLIELQKAKQAFDVMRFRRYLGENYRKEDDVSNSRGLREKRPLPIVTIYFLGFSLDNIPNAVVKINREYRDVITQEVIYVKEEFVELLTHDTFVIQIRKLTGQTRTKLERVLQVFRPEFQTEDPHQLDFKGDVGDPLVRKVVDRLGRAIASDEIREKMDVEDEIYRLFEREMNKLALEKDTIIAEERMKIIQERQRADEERQRADEERQNAEKERQKNEALQKEIEALKTQLKKPPPQ